MRALVPLIFLAACAPASETPAPVPATAAPSVAEVYNSRLACLGEGWARILNAGAQRVEQTESFTEDGVEIHAYEFTGLEGDYPKVVGFFAFDGSCYTKAVTFGSYVYVTTLNRELGRIGADERAYHADYYDAEGHISLSFSKTPPTYDRARRQALSRL